MAKACFSSLLQTAMSANFLLSHRSYQFSPSRAPSARDSVLESLYDKIKDRFVGLYRDMHGPDEKYFDAAFTAKDAGLSLNVDFYGRGSTHHKQCTVKDTKIAWVSAFFSRALNILIRG